MAGTNHCDTGLVRLPDEGRKSFSIREELDVKQIGTAADTDRAAEISVLLRRQGGFSALCFGAKGHEQELFAQRCSQTGQHPLPCGSIQSIRKPVGPPLDAVGLQRGQPPGLTENFVLCAGDDGQDDFRTACADAAAADGDAGHDNYLTAKRCFHHTACPAACQACRSKNRKQAAFCGNLHLRDDRKSFTISAAKAVWPAWGCAAFFVLGGKENEGNENDCAGAGGLSGG